jgi:hypothetical protein
MSPTNASSIADSYEEVTIPIPAGQQTLWIRWEYDAGWYPPNLVGSQSFPPPNWVCADKIGNSNIQVNFTPELAIIDLKLNWGIIIAPTGPCGSTSTVVVQFPLFLPTRITQYVVTTDTMNYGDLADAEVTLYPCRGVGVKEPVVSAILNNSNQKEVMLNIDMKLLPTLNGKTLIVAFSQASLGTLSVQAQNGLPMSLRTVGESSEILIVFDITNYLERYFTFILTSPTNIDLQDTSPYHVGIPVYYAFGNPTNKYKIPPYLVPMYSSNAPIMTFISSAPQYDSLLPNTISNTYIFHIRPDSEVYFHPMSKTTYHFDMVNFLTCGITPGQNTLNAASFMFRLNPDWGVQISSPNTGHLFSTPIYVTCTFIVSPQVHYLPIATVQDAFDVNPLALEYSQPFGFSAGLYNTNVPMTSLQTIQGILPGINPMMIEILPLQYKYRLEQTSIKDSMYTRELLRITNPGAFSTTVMTITVHRSIFLFAPSDAITVSNFKFHSCVNVQSGVSTSLASPCSQPYPFLVSKGLHPIIRNKVVYSISYVQTFIPIYAPILEIPIYRYLNIASTTDISYSDPFDDSPLDRIYSLEFSTKQYNYLRKDATNSWVPYLEVLDQVTKFDTVTSVTNTHLPEFFFGRTPTRTSSTTIFPISMRLPPTSNKNSPSSYWFQNDGFVIIHPGSILRFESTVTNWFISSNYDVRFSILSTLNGFSLQYLGTEPLSIPSNDVIVYTQVSNSALQSSIISITPGIRIDYDSDRTEVLSNQLNLQYIDANLYFNVGSQTATFSQSLTPSPSAASIASFPNTPITVAVTDGFISVMLANNQLLPHVVEFVKYSPTASTVLETHNNPFTTAVHSFSISPTVIGDDFVVRVRFTDVHNENIVFTSSKFRILSSCWVWDSTNWVTLCKNGEECLTSGQCRCVIGQNGETCERTGSDCNLICPSNNNNNNNNIDSCNIAQNTCKCKSNYIGDQCQVTTSCNDPKLNQCGVNTGNGYLPERTGTCSNQCTCLGHWVSTNCDMCSLQCQNNGTADKKCTKCYCRTGFTGEFCDCIGSVGRVTINGFNAVLVDYFELNKSPLNNALQIDGLKPVYNVILNDILDAIVEMLQLDNQSITMTLDAIPNANQNNEVIPFYTGFSITIKYGCNLYNTDDNLTSITSKWNSFVAEIIKNEIILKYFTFDGDVNVDSELKPIQADPEIQPLEPNTGGGFKLFCHIIGVVLFVFFGYSM